MPEQQQKWWQSRRAIMVLMLVPILALLNVSIFEKEHLRKNGTRLLLELAPVDPRSLMQGDYMELEYALADDLEDAMRVLLKSERAQKQKADQKSDATQERLSSAIAALVPEKNPEQVKKEEAQRALAKRILPMRDGHLIVRKGEKDKAVFVDVYDGQALKDSQWLIPFKHNLSRELSFIIIQPTSFFFQEGHAQSYENAKYGIFRISNNGSVLLTGLADENGEMIEGKVQKAP